MSFSGSVRLAVGTLTVWPTGPVDVNPAVARLAMTIAPLAVLPLAVVTAATAWASDRLDAPNLLTGLLAVAVLAGGTRALHLDGLADTADGLGSGWDRDRALEVMRRGDIGPMGVVSVALVLAIQAAAFGELASGALGAVQLAVLICCSRAALVLVCLRGIPAARTGGLGAAVAGSVPRLVAGAVWVAVAAALIATSLLNGDSWVAGLAATLLAAVSVAVLLRRCLARLGGVTGDVMGACIEVAGTALAVGSVLQWPGL